MTKTKIYDLWARHLARPRFRKMHSLLMQLALRGLGVGNSASDDLSGEKWFVSTFLAQRLSGIGKPHLFDVGANQGEYALKLRRVFPTAEITCFEPGSQTFTQLQQAAEEAALDAVPLAVGRAPGEAILYDYADEGASQHASLVQGAIELQHGGLSKGTPVQMTSLDQFCLDRAVARIDFLKIDVEGNEYACLEGARGLLESDKIGAIQLEFNSMNLLVPVTMSQFYALMGNFDFYRLLPRGLLRLDRNDPVQSNLFHFQNIVALPCSSENPPR